jgi:hypothetical protein
MPYFDYQRIVDQLVDLAGYPLEKDARELHDVLTNTELTAPALWFLGAAPDLQGILDDLSHDEATLDLWLYQLGSGAFANREYPDAADTFARLEEQPSFFAVARIFRIYSLCHANQINAARHLADETYSGHPDMRRWEQWWDLFREEFNIDPRTAG